MSFERITESNSNYDDLELKSSLELLKIINKEDQSVAFSIQKELDEARILHEQAQSLLANEKRKLEKCDEDIKEILKLARDQAAILSENSKKIFEEEIQRKQKQADLKIIQARDDAIREVKSKATDLSTIIAKEYLKENIDDKISSDLVDKSIEDLKRNL